MRFENVARPIEEAVMPSRKACYALSSIQIHLLENLAIPFFGSREAFRLVWQRPLSQTEHITEFQDGLDISI